MEPTQEMKRPDAKAPTGTFNELAAEAHAQALAVAEKAGSKVPQDRVNDLDEFCLAAEIAMHLDGLSVRQAHEVLRIVGVVINQASGVSAEQLRAFTEPQIAGERSLRSARAQFALTPRA